jgi:type VI secretion system protein VasD
VLFAAATLSGCGMFSKKPAPPEPFELELNIAAGPQLNPNVQKRASPVVVRVFDLKSPASFESADFVSLFERDREVLAADLVARDEMVLRPGEQKRIKRVLQGETKVLGVAAAFRELERATWRTTIVLTPGKKNRINLNIDGIVVAATTAK